MVWFGLVFSCAKFRLFCGELNSKLRTGRKEAILQKRKYLLSLFCQNMYVTDFFLTNDLLLFANPLRLLILRQIYNLFDLYSYSCNMSLLRDTNHTFF